jgi:hypothetical protein
MMVKRAGEPTPGIPQHMHPVIPLVTAGVEMDVIEIAFSAAKVRRRALSCRGWETALRMADRTPQFRGRDSERMPTFSAHQSEVPRALPGP